MNEFLRWLPTVTALLIYAERMRELSTKRDVVPGKTEETVTLKIFILCGALTVLGGLAEHHLAPRGLWWPAFAAGVVVSIGAFAIRRSAIRELGKFWSLNIEMRDTHIMITSGPFSRVRHPAYLSMILEHIGIALILLTPITLAVALAIFLPALAVRIRREEAALVRQFGADYEAYRARSGLIFPKL